MIKNVIGDVIQDVVKNVISSTDAVAAAWLPSQLGSDLLLWAKSSDAYTTGALSFLASDLGVFQAAANTVHDLTTDDILISFWVNLQDTGTSAANVLSKIADASNQWTCVITANETIQFRAEVGGVEKILVESTTTLTVDDWYHVLICVDRTNASNCKIYLNGVDDTSGTPTVSADSITNTGTFEIGASDSGSVADYHLSKIMLGLPSDVSAIEAAAVTSLYNFGDGKTYDQLTTDEQSDFGISSGFAYNCNETGDADGYVATLFDAIDDDLTWASSEFVSNGTFTGSAAGWFLGSWAYGTNNVYHQVGVNGNMYQANIGTSQNRYYNTSYDVLNYVADSVRIRMGAYGTWRSANGTHTETLFSGTSGFAGVQFYFTTNALDCSIDNVSVTSAGVIPVQGPAAINVRDSSTNENHGTLQGRSAGDVAGAFSGNTPHGTYNPTIKDESGSLNHGLVFSQPIYGSTAPSGYDLTFDGTDDLVAVNSAGNVTSVDTRVKLVVDNQIILSLDSSAVTAVSVVAGVLTFGASLTPSNIQVDGVAKTASEAGAMLNDNSWHRLQFDLVSISAARLRLATDGASYGNVALSDFKVNAGALIDWQFSQATREREDLRDGLSVSLDGSDDYAVTRDNAGIVGDPAFTVMGWVRPTSVGDDEAIVSLGDFTVAGQACALVLMSNGSFGLSFGGANNAHSSAGMISTGNWIHVAAVKTAGPADSTTKLYLNGTDVPLSSPASITPNLVDDLIGIGRDPDNDLAVTIHGEIQQVKVFARALSHEEVLYEARPVNGYGTDPGLTNLELDMNFQDFGLSLPADGDPIAGLIAVDGSGNRLNLRNNALTNRPTYVASAVSSKPAISCDGIDDYLSVLQPIGISGDAEFELFAIIKSNSANDEAFIGFGEVDNLGTTTNGNMYFQNNATNNTGGDYSARLDVDAPGKYFHTTENQPAYHQLLHWTKDAGSLNGNMSLTIADVTTDPLSTSTATQHGTPSSEVPALVDEGLAIGDGRADGTSTKPMTGEIVEVIVTKPLTADMQQKMYDYIAETY